MKLFFFTSILIVLLSSCSESSNNSNDVISSIDYMQIGDSISNIAQKELLSNVSKQMKNGGPVHTVSFCNLNANKIMDSISTANNITTSRVSAKNRNENNLASHAEMDILDYLDEAKENSMIKDTEEGIVFYKSIRLGMPACLKCHGNIETDISPETLEILSEKYPNDKATNYALGDFRGAWKIVFKK